jgi:hypothetical protein
MTAYRIHVLQGVGFHNIHISPKQADSEAYKQSKPIVHYHL